MTCPRQEERPALSTSVYKALSWVGRRAVVGYNPLMSSYPKSDQDTTRWCDSIGLPRDTTREAMAKQFEILRRIGPAGRLAMAFDLCDHLRSLAEAGVRLRHSDWDDLTVEREVIRLMVGDDLFRKAYATGGRTKP